jgi:hypothetical protein
MAGTNLWPTEPGFQSGGEQARTYQDYRETNAHDALPDNRVTFQVPNTHNAPATDGVAPHELTLVEKARAAVDAKTEEVSGRISDATRRVQHELDAATQGLQKELNPDSHELAHDNSAIRGAVTQHRAATGTDGRITDIGWHKATETIPDPLIYGIPNGAVFSYIRRFNKVRYYCPVLYFRISAGTDWFCRMSLTFDLFLWRSLAVSISTSRGLQIMPRKRSPFSSRGSI